MTRNGDVKMFIYPGQKIITIQGTVRTVAYVSTYGIVYAYNPRGGLEVIVPRSDAWGGDQDLLAA